LDLLDKQKSTFRWVDTSEIEEFQLKHPREAGVHAPRLKVLAWACLGRMIQRKVHDATEDAVASLDILKRVCVEGTERTQEALLRVTAQMDVALEGRNVPAAAEYEEAKRARRHAKKESDAASLLARIVETKYAEALKASAAEDVLAAKKQRWDAAIENATTLRKLARFLDKEQVRIKRYKDSQMRKAKNAIVLEGVNPNEVAPRRTVAAAAAAASNAEEEGEEGAGGAGGEGAGAAVAAEGEGAGAAVAASTKPLTAMGGAGGSSLPKRKTRRARNHSRRRNP